MKIKFFFLTLLCLFITNSFRNGTSVSKIEFFDMNISYSSLYHEIIKSNILYPDVVFAQALLESGNLTSNVYKVENNLFGMKFPRKRKTTSSKKGETGYANYEHWTESVYDYKLWQNQTLRNKKIETQSEYLNHLGNVYAEDIHYITKLKSFLTKS